ncbi:hypothetical protein G3O08_01185 [Cryomorpha ignava]|uniref:Uncharacterized protein n=1 Tax=Cryomorpha ignava TaxID=101383 RepID=A0A7K3WKE2_9FLAO|nr:hypothetical protein [Cryomorpha ignava]NEN22117.1 hypothetical protein [Cryomorpha ignava]
MNYTELQSFFHHHCKIKLRSGKEVFGVVWKDLPETDKAIYFASYIEHKKLMSQQIATNSDPAKLLKLEIDDILGIEPIVS